MGEWRGVNGKILLPTPFFHPIWRLLSPDFRPGASNGWRCSNHQASTITKHNIYWLIFLNSITGTTTYSKLAIINLGLTWLLRGKQTVRNKCKNVDQLFTRFQRKNITVAMKQLVWAYVCKNLAVAKQIVEKADLLNPSQSQSTWCGSHPYLWCISVLHYFYRVSILKPDGETYYRNIFKQTNY
jgi:hypothetical protein